MASNVNNVFTGGLTQNPDWTPAQLDPGTASIIQQQLNEGSLSQQDLVNRQLAGTNEHMDAATGGAVAQQQGALGGNDPSVSQALNDRANRMYDSQYNQLHNAAVAGAPAHQGALMNQSAHSLGQQQDINDALNRQQMEVTANKTAMRNQVIKQIFGAGGSFAGTYYGNKAGKQANAQQQGAQTDQTMSDLGNTQMNYSSPSGGSGYGLGVASNGSG